MQEIYYIWIVGKFGLSEDVFECQLSSKCSGTFLLLNLQKRCDVTASRFSQFTRVVNENIDLDKFNQ